MAKTRTQTWTNTYTRVQVLAFQINYVVRATTGDTSFEDIAETGIIQNQWIEVVDIYGLDRNGDIHAHVVMRIDWERHRFHIKADRNAIHIDENLPEGERLDFLIGNIVKAFNKRVEEEDLTTKMTFQYVAGVNRTRANRQIGAVDTTAPKWAKGVPTHVKKHDPEKLDEFSIGFTLLVPEGDSGEKSQRKRGTVKRFDAQKGYGFIIPDTRGADVFVHYSQISGSGYRTLTEGQTVEFDIEKTHKGLEAVNVVVIK
jgi:CspA family cold shock protein